MAGFELSKAELDNEKFSLRFFPEDGYVLVEMKGDISLKDLIDCFSSLVRHPSFVFNMSACYDFTKAFGEVNMKSKDLFSQFSIAMEEKRGDSYYLALVHSDPLTKASLELYKLSFARRKVDIEIFSSRATAIEWVKESISLAGLTRN